MEVIQLMSQSGGSGFIRCNDTRFLCQLQNESELDIGANECKWGGNFNEWNEIKL